MEEKLPRPRLDVRTPSPDALPPRTGADLQGLRREVERLKAARQALEDERRKALPALTSPPGESEEAARLRLQIAELLARVGKRGKPEKAPEEKAPPPQPEPPPAPKTPENKTLSDRPVDPLALGHALFRTENYEAALKAYQQIDVNALSPTDRLMVQYATASCLRKLGRVEEAMVLYREVANSGGDELLVENAQWHLNAIKWQRDLEAQIDQVRQRRQALQGTKP
jgi:tetratricopeptide (TPR) repeat protein